MTPTTHWYCDSCHLVIANREDGWVEWITASDAPPATRGLRIVHRLSASPRRTSGGCQYDAKVESARDGGRLSDDSLDQFLGPNGVMLALSLADAGVRQAAHFEFLKRLFVPGYERARFHLRAGIAAGVIQPNLPPGRWDKDVDTLLTWASTQGRSP